MSQQSGSQQSQRALSGRVLGGLNALLVFTEELDNQQQNEFNEFSEQGRTLEDIDEDDDIVEAPLFNSIKAKVLEK